MWVREQMRKAQEARQDIKAAHKAMIQASDGEGLA